MNPAFRQDGAAKKENGFTKTTLQTVDWAEIKTRRFLSPWMALFSQEKERCGKEKEA